MNHDAPRCASLGRRSLLAFVACASLAACGCGDDLAQVSGRVTVDGEPLRGGPTMHATVYFQPAAGQGLPAAGVVDKNGDYQLSTGSRQGIVPGEYVATCSAAEIIASGVPGGTPTGRRVTDPKYASAKTSELRFTVQPGDNQCDIALQSPRGDSRRRGGG